MVVDSQDLREEEEVFLGEVVGFLVILGEGEGFLEILETGGTLGILVMQETRVIQNVKGCWA